jgi:xanthomonalisin
MKKSTKLFNARKSLLPAALSVALMSMSVHADETLVSTRTHAGIQSSNGASTLVMTNHPTIDASHITPLEQSKTLHISVSLNLRNADELQSFLESVNDANSANYHQFLTPDQFKAKFAPTNEQAQAVVNYLEANGFHNITVAPNNMLVSADGNASNVNAAFRADMRRFTYKGASHFANASDVVVPQSLGGVIDAVMGLQDYAKPHVMSHRATPGAIKAQAAAGVVAHDPTDFPQIYDAGSTPTASNTTVGIITWGEQNQTITDLNTFTKNNGLATVNTAVVQGSAGTLGSSSGVTEWDLDSQDIVAMSGGVKQLIFYAALSASDADITAAYNTAVTADVAKVINVSLGEDETAANNSGTQAADDKAFAQAVAQGQTFSVASGDAGVYEWSNDPTEGSPGYVANANGTVEISLTHYSVSEPASSPNVVAVGGTTLSTNGTTTWAGETVWNEGLAQIDPNGQNNGGTPDDNERLWASGGGVSLFEAAPAWQTTALGASVTKRQVPDLAFDAAQTSGANIIMYGQTEQVGGTSLASPLFVGMWARIESANNNSLGLPTQNMYTYFPKDATPLHDVTVGNNGYNGNGYNAGAGYDNTTGWGSLDISKFNAYVTKYWGVAGGGVATNTPSNVTAVSSGLCLAVSGGSTAAAASIVQSACSTTNQSENWSLVPVGNYYHLVVQSTGQCLNVDGGTGTNGTKLIQYPCQGASTTNDQWSLVAVGSAYHIVSRASGLCVNVSGGSLSAGGSIIQWTCQSSTTTNDQWKF